MNELERHIEILLLSNDCVIVPDLGGFMTHHVDARYDEEEQIFLPPLRTLGFNPQLKINDSMLAQSYVEAYEISYPEALRRIEDEVTELKMRLHEEGSYELNDIGTLSLNEDGNYVFVPCEAGILTPSLYGLGSFNIEQFQHADKTVRMYTEPSAAEETSEDVELEPTEKEEEEDVVKIKFSWIRNAVAVAAVLLAIFIVALPTGKTELMTKTISNINNSILFGMMSKDTNTSKIDIKKADLEKSLNKTDTILKADTCKKPAEEQMNTTEKGYCIVLASYVTKKNAQTFVEQLQKRGYQDSKVYIHNNVTRVIFGNFKTQDDAQTALRDIHQHKDLAEAWIYKLN